MTTTASISARAVAVSFPMPELLPVTMQTLHFILSISSPSLEEIFRGQLCMKRTQVSLKNLSLIEALAQAEMVGANRGFSTM
jgi:hypothetical protein